MTTDDTKFLQAMIEHHESALTMAREYLDATSPASRQARVADLARDIIKAQTAEIDTIRGWLRAGPAAGEPKMSM